MLNQVVHKRLGIDVYLIATEDPCHNSQPYKRANYEKEKLVLL